MRDKTTESPEAVAVSEMNLSVTAIKSYQQVFSALPSGDGALIAKALAGDNPKKQQFIEKADWLDPWGHPYHIFITGKSFLIRCAGPNGAFDDGNGDKRDDILIESSVP